MNGTMKGSAPMTDAEVLREMRQDIRDLHTKFDGVIQARYDDKLELISEIGKIDKVSSINTVKLHAFTAGIAIFFSGVVGFGFHVFAG
jgi:hypothetical protein